MNDKKEKEVLLKELQDNKLIVASCCCGNRKTTRVNC